MYFGKYTNNKQIWAALAYPIYEKLLHVKMGDYIG